MMASSTLHSFPTVAEFYRGRDIFLTGGTGFIGKVFIEKMLRCCPDIGDIYLLVRPRRSQTVHERLKKMFKEKVSWSRDGRMTILTYISSCYAIED